MAVFQQHPTAPAPDAESALDNQKTSYDYSQRAQWLRAAFLGANDGLVSTASLMMGVGALKTDVKAMIIAGLAGLIAGAGSMAIGEFVSVYSQLDIEVAQMKREEKAEIENGGQASGEKEERVVKKLPSPVLAAVASALSFSVGAMVPLLAAAFIKRHDVRLGVLCCAVSLALVVFGALGAKLGGASMWRSCVRVLLSGWLAMLLNFGLMKLFGFKGL